MGMTRWLRAFVLALPLIGIVGWLAAGAHKRSFGARAESAQTVSEASQPSLQLPGLPAPDAELPPERLHEQVDGAADFLIEAGCRRLLVWTLEDPPSTLELLVFERDEQAGRVLSHDVGPERTPGPGDEAVVSAEAVYFRRARFYARLIGEPGAASQRARLERLAAVFDRALQALPRAESP